MISTNVPPLSYAPLPRWHRRRRFRRVILLLLAIAIVAAGVRWGPQHVQQARLLYWQRECMKYRAPADQIVYERGPGAAALLTTSHEYTPLATTSGVPAPTGREPACLAAYQKLAGLTPPSGGGVLFVHALKTRSRPSRLVIVRSNFAADTAPMFIPGFDLEVTVLDPATWKMPQRNVTAGMPIDVRSSILKEPPRVRVYAGQIDPADPSHFTIRYEFDGKPYIADGRIEEMGAEYVYTTVQFTTRPEGVPPPPR